MAAAKKPEPAKQGTVKVRLECVYGDKKPGSIITLPADVADGLMAIKFAVKA